MITVQGINRLPIRLIWETSLKDIGQLTITWDKDAKIPLKVGDAINVTWGEAGNLQKATGYKVHRIVKEKPEIIAWEFGKEWLAKAQKLYRGPRQSAMQELIKKNGDKVGKITAQGGQKAYTQNESDIAFLFRLAGNIPVWRGDDGAVNVSDPEEAKIKQVIDYTPASIAGRRYVAAGFTPDGKAFEVAIGEGQETRVSEVFHSPAEARDYLARLVAAQPRGKLVCVGQAGIRAGAKVVLDTGAKHTVTRCIHEVRHDAWIVTAYLN